MINPMSLDGKRILVTGASSGIGRETSIVLSELGAKIILSGRNIKELEITKAQLIGDGHTIESYDLTDIENIPEWLKRIANNCNRISGIVHCAGVQLTKSIRSVNLMNIESVMKINVYSTISIAKGIRQAGVADKNLSIVIISSVMSICGQAGLSIYSASKAAVNALVRSLAVEFASDGIRINCIAAGYIRTELIDHVIDKMPPGQIEIIDKMHLLGMGRPRDIANAAAFLLADSGRWITGTSLIVDGGYSVR